MSIQEHLNKIRNAIKGSEVRESIAKGIETAYDDASEKDNANMEVKIARGTHPNLRSRLEEVDNKQQQTTAQLAQTVKHGENESISKRMLEHDLLEEINNGEVNVNVNTSMIDDGAVTSKKTTFIKTSNNLFDKSKLTFGYNINLDTGRLIPSSVSYVAPRRRINPNEDYYLTGSNRYAFFDSKGNFISAHGGGYLLNIPSNAYEIMVSTTNPDLLQMSNSDVELPYEEYFEPYLIEEINVTNIPDKIVTTNKLADKAVAPGNTTFIKTSSNLYKPDEELKGKYISSTGVITDGTYNTSDFIDLMGATEISKRDIWYIAWYDRQKNFIRRTDYPSAEQANVTPVEVPTTAYHIRAMAHATISTKPQINLGAELLEYEPHYKRLDESIQVSVEKVEDDSDGESEVKLKDKKTLFSLEPILLNYTLDDGTYPQMTLEELDQGFEQLTIDYPEFLQRTNVGKDESGLYDVYRYKTTPREYVGEGFGNDNKFARKRPKIAFNGLAHGFEYPSAITIYNMIKLICEEWRTDSRLEYLRHNLELEFIAIVNPWGYVNNNYSNSNGVNIQTNFPINHNGNGDPLSEKESIYVKNLIDDNVDADLYIDLHSAGFNTDIMPNVDSFFYYLYTSGNNYNENIDFASKNAVEINTNLIKKTYPHLSNTQNDKMLGWTTLRVGSGTIDEYANSLGIPSVVMEVGYNFEGNNRTYSSDGLKAATEVFINNLMVFLKQLKSANGQ